MYNFFLFSYQNKVNFSVYTTFTCHGEIGQLLRIGNCRDVTGKYETVEFRKVSSVNFIHYFLFIFSKQNLKTSHVAGL